MTRLTCHHNKTMRSKTASAGFTMVELLAVVGILAIVGLIAVFSLGRLRLDLRQRELDSKAELLYTAAQKQMAELHAAGWEDWYQPGTDGVVTMPFPPSDADEESQKTSFCYVLANTAAEKETTAAAAILPMSAVDAELWDGCWYIEYAPDSGSVYAVFYSASPLPDPNTLDDYRSYQYRRRMGAKVGYYGGDIAQTQQTGTLQPSLTIENAEKLTATFYCNRPTEQPITLTIQLSDGISTYTKKLAQSQLYQQGSRLYRYTWVLDDLTRDSTRFYAQTGGKLLCGVPITVTLTASSDDPLVDQVSVSAVTNGLFDDRTDYGTDSATALISCGRHLQNLDETSKLAPVITRAVQEKNIDFTGASGWASVYGEKKFHPIVNTALREYRGSYTVDGTTYRPVIAHLPVDTNGDAGLFESFSGGTLADITLTGAQIRGTGRVGGLAGTLSGTVSVTGCRVYLDPASDGLSTKTERDIWLAGNVTGGLVGYVSGNAEVSIDSSFAASVLRGTTAAGGLIGQADGAVTAERCYADCYLYNSDKTNGQTGGLFGGSIGTSTIRLTSCYAAGFQEAAVTAGLSAGPVKAMTGCYSVSVPLNADIDLTYSTAKPDAQVQTAAAGTFYLKERAATAKHIAGTTDVGYGEWSGASRPAAAQRLGTAFTAVTGGGSTNAYNLMEGMGLTDYSYPKLQGIPHYGDWKAEFESGSLAYYEHYQNGTAAGYGFLGGNVSSLRDDETVLGDGYGMIYDSKPTASVTVTYWTWTAAGVAVQKTEMLAADAADAAVQVTYNGRSYYLLPLPTGAVNTEYVDPNSFYQEVRVGNTTYLYAPHFARTVTTPGEDGTVESPTGVSIRTARQLYALSLYYDEYRERLDESSVFVQERGIDYVSYDWKNYGRNGTEPSANLPQFPIGDSTAKPFIHTYNGQRHEIISAPITGNGLGRGGTETAGEVYAGLFGCNAGELRDIVLIAGREDTIVGFDRGIQRRSAYIGALVGYNSGTVRGCAAAGYRAKALANSGSAVYVGGFIGYNEGYVEQCSVSSPSVYAENVFAQLSAGGFAGQNDGRIEGCYGIAAINVPTVRGGEVELGGFAAHNGGIIRRAYCATAMSSAGAEADGFTASGSVQDCYYLNGGTYRFWEEDRLYSAETAGGAQPMTAAELEELKLSGFETQAEAEARYSRKNAEDSYPYPACMQDASGVLVHYGDWPVPTNVGEVGVFYWEKEEDGANSGYHLSYIGFVGTERKEGSTLCTAHDDGGVITAYGYGYYWESSSQKPTLTESSGFVMDGGDTEEARAAASALGAQMPEYTFTAYETGETGLRLQSASDANGTWILNRGTSRSYTYTVCPFFADAFGYAGDAEPGTDQAAYQVRSVQQLQFINWSCGVTSKYIGSRRDPNYTFTYETGTDREVTAATYQQFPYLQYATVTGVSRQSQSAAERDRPRRSWKQSHDLNGTDREFPKVGAKNTSFHPIAGAVFNNAAENPNNEGYAVDLYSWFGGVYDGDNYYIKNINIDSPCYNVGVFGTTAGAEIRNIVLYSDNGGTIERSTPAGTDYRNYRCAYALGGLVGIAYDYLYDANGKWVDVENRAAEIANCAIAGYTIEDNSTNPLQLGEAVVGGLIGVSKVDLNSCSAVVDIKVNCTHREAGDSGKLTRAQYGNFVRVGGLVGGVQYKVTNCYTGGTITIGSDTLNERVDKSGSLVTVKTSTEKETEVENAKGTYVYIGGIGGSGFSSNFRNFSNKNGTDDGEPEYENCYTYTGLPTMQGTIMAISRIGSVADRYEWAPSVTITNCYYYAESDVQYNLPKYYCGKKSLATILASDAEKEKMLQGDLSYLSKYIGGRNHRPSYSIDLTKLSYEQMAGRKDVAKNGQDKRILELLNQNGDSVFGWVTVEEAQAEVHGKYSFPGKNIAVLDGQDYPFPTVLTQASEHTDSGRANLHYGDWPLVGPAWEKSSVTIDRITDYDAKTGAPVITAVLKLENMEDGKLGGLTLESFRSTNESIARVTGFEPLDAKSCRVTLVGLANGSVEITAALDGHVARLMVSVTAELTIRMSDEIERAKQITVNEAATVPLGLAALDRGGKALTKDLSWTVANAETGIAQIVWKNGVPQSVRGIGAGETTLLITASYRINETETVTVSRIVPVTVLAKAADGTA